MDMKSILYLVLIALGALSMYTPWLQLSKSERLNETQLHEKHSEHGWIRWGFIVIYFLWIVLAFEVLHNIPWSRAILFLGVFFSSIGFFIGMFALITGVCILVPTIIPRLLFVVGENARRAGRFQVLCSSTVFLITCAVNFFGS